MSKHRLADIRALRGRIGRKTTNHYRIKTGHAGFIQLFKNGARIQPHNLELTFNKRKAGDDNKN